jgi:hypothetical protein
MNRNGNLILDVRQVPSLEAALDQWLAARDDLKMQPSEGNQHEYNATLYDLGPLGANDTQMTQTRRRRLSGSGVASLPRRRSVTTTAY